VGGINEYNCLEGIMNIPAKFIKRVNDSLKKYQDIVVGIKKRDANETDTVTVIKDILSDIFGYDKYTEITSEYAIRQTYCDLAIIDNNKKPRFLIEVKGVSIVLNDNHIKQAVDYGANSGVNWVILTNGEDWKIYKIIFGKPIEKELVAEFNILKVNPKNEKDLEALFIISKDGQEKSTIEDYYTSIQVKNKFIIGSILNGSEVHSLIKRTMRKLFEDVKITDEEIAGIMANDIIKREIIDSEESKKAKKDIDKAVKKLEKIKAKEAVKASVTEAEPPQEDVSKSQP
jgi:predicted type IV restriction endonuclease